MTERKIFLCTKETPWSKEKDTGGPVHHLSAYSDGESYDSELDYYYCPICKHRWSVEVGK